MQDIKLRNMTSLYLMSGEKILFLYRIGSKVINDSYTGAAGGHFENDELNDPKACVLRELYEETGLTENDIENLALRYITLRLKNGEIRQNYYFFADLKNPDAPITSNEGNLEWADFDKAMLLDMPYTSKYVVAHYIKTGRHTSALYCGAAHENGVTFTDLHAFP